jgi:hypothetical protein
MSAVFGRRRRWLDLWIGTLLAATAAMAATAVMAETVAVNIDEARILRLPDKVATIVIGNPLIADATLQSGGILVLTGKGYGSTNLLVLDRGGQVIMDRTVQVRGPSGSNLVVVYKGIERESYSCAPLCEPRITLGDAPPYFANTLAQSGARSGQAQTK